MILIDEFRLNILLYNLISNSIKYTNGGTIKIQIKIFNQK